MNAAHKELLEYIPFLARPARKQCEEYGGRQQDQPAGTVYNIWYNKWAGGDRFGSQAMDKAETRCSIARDCGYTRATKSSFFCVHFARGCCAKGVDCNFWHRIPLETDKIPMAQDIFGRDRFRDERDDMGGVGSFEKDNRTLYIGQLGLASGLEDTVYKHFIEWGEIEYLRVLTGRGVAFVRYRHRYSAEFAKEAMLCQSLDANEIMNVRWATEDPNPKAAALKKRKAEEVLVDALRKNLPQLGDGGNILDYQGYFNNAAEASEAAKAQEHASKHIRTEKGWDTVNGFFYAENEKAAIKLQGAEDQADQQPFSGTEENPGELGGFGDPSQWAGAASGPVKTQPSGAQYVEGVGKSRYYTGIGMPHAETRLKLQKKALEGITNTVASVMQVKAAQQQQQQLQGSSNQLAIPPPPPPRQTDASPQGSQQQAPPPPPHQNQNRAAHPQQHVPDGPKGILSNATFQYLAELQARKQYMVASASSTTAEKVAPAAVPAKKTGRGLLLADYGSDDDEE
ncbi:Pre-mRNA-splicing factor [Chytridiales sp. JEL 0842]|nr:Pre-mRNA-splicing factor [Chytridiales sp. JEL 0842]